VGSDVVTPPPLTHCTTEHGRKLVLLLLVMARIVAALPANALVGESEPDPRAGAGRFAVGEEMVNCSAFDCPPELDTVTAALVLVAVSMGRIAAES